MQVNLSNVGWVMSELLRALFLEVTSPLQDSGYKHRCLQGPGSSCKQVLQTGLWQEVSGGVKSWAALGSTHLS